MLIFPLYFDHYSGLPKIQKTIFNLISIKKKKLFFFVKDYNGVSLVFYLGLVIGVIKYLIFLLRVSKGKIVAPNGGIALISLFGKWIKGHKLLYIIHLANFVEYGFFRMIIFHFVLNNCDNIVVISEQMRSLIKPHVRKKIPISLIYNPIFDLENASHFSYKTRKEGSPIKLISVGRLCEQKDFHILLDALNILDQKCEIYCEILGTGPLFQELNARVLEEKLVHVVNFRGFVEDVPKALSEADCFVLHSKYEGLPTSLIEAIAYCPRVVSFDIPTGPVEILKDTSFEKNIVKSRTAKSLARAIFKSVSEPIPTSDLRNLHRFSYKVAKHQYETLLA